MSIYIEIILSCAQSYVIELVRKYLVLDVLIYSGIILILITK